MSALELVNRLRTSGIGLSVADGKLRLKAEKGALTDELKAEIVANRDELIALLSNVAAGAAREAPIPQADRNADLPCSFAQQRLWFLDALEPGTPLYNMPFVSRIQGALDKGILQQALSQLAARHESLRTSFAPVNGKPVQKLAAETSVVLAERDGSNLDSDAQQALLTELAQHSFDLSQQPLMQATLITLSDDEALLMLVFHHVIADLWSVDVYLRELSVIYQAIADGANAQLPDLKIQYADYAAWQRDTLSGDNLERYLNFWRNRLAGAPEVTNLPTDYPRPAEPSYKGNWIEHSLPADLSTALKELARKHNSTPFMLFLAAFNVLLARYSGDNDIVIGTPVAGRNRQELENLIGFFLNTLVVRTELDQTQSFADLLTQVRKENLTLREYQDLPFERLVEELQPERDMSVSPVFQTMFIWQEETDRSIKIPGLSIGAAELTGHGTAKFDITLSCSDIGSHINIGIEYATDLFATSTIEGMLSHFENLLRNIVARPQKPLSALQLLSAAERDEQLSNRSGSTAAYANLPMHQLIEQQVAANANAPALEANGESITYAELNARANRLAHHLTSLGVSKGDSVAVCAGRELNTAIAALAAIKAGANYTPLDPEYPAERLEYMFGDCKPGVVLSTKAVADKLTTVDAQLVLLDEFDFTAGNDANPLPELEAGDPLYTIYTSGSTGLPKGVMLPQSTIANLSQWQNDPANHNGRLGVPARTLQFAPLSFDVNVQELFTTWASGGTVVMIDGDTRRDMPALASFIAANNIERVYLPFAALRPLSEAFGDKPDLQLKLNDVITAGEQLQITPEIRELFKRLPECRLHNQYGPSETHVVTALTLNDNPDGWPLLPSIGSAVTNCRVYILDEALQPVPVGAAGELCLGGTQVALGYLGKPELTAEKFVDNPYVGSEKMYRTGDQVRFNLDGEIEFLGRIDDQVKFRGFRIEPGEIAAKLSHHDAVQQASVMLREDVPGNKQIVAYVIATETGELDSQLKQHLKQTLPDYMIPSAIVVLDELPLTPSGKINTRALPAPDMSAVLADSYVAPATAVQTTLCEVWAEILGVERAGINDDFFALGGHSLLATQLLSRIRDQLKVSLPLKYLFRYPTPAELAITIETLQGAVSETVPEDEEEREEFSL